MDPVHQTPFCPIALVPKYVGNSNFSAFWQTFELAIKMNGWIYLEATNYLAV